MAIAMRRVTANKKIIHGTISSLFTIQIERTNYRSLIERLLLHICNSIEYVLQRHSCFYVFLSFRNDSKNCTNDKILSTEDMPDMEVEFTPDLTWKCKAKSRESDNSNPIIKGIATPVIKSLESVLQSEILTRKNHF